MKKTIYFNGNIICVDKENSICQALLIEDGKIKAVGTNEDILNLKDDAVIIDLEGKTMLPGFIDPHGHIVAVAQSLMLLNFSEVTSIEEFLKKLKDKLEKNPPKEGEWLIGLGYDNSKFPKGKHPTKFDLDKVSTETPIFVTHASGHLATCNSKALELFRYSGEDYIVPDGGVVQTVEGSREANGVLEEGAFLSAEKKSIVGSPSFETVLESLVNTQKLYTSYGITTCQDASVDTNINQLLLTADNNKLLNIDIIGYAIQPYTKDLMGDTTTFTAKYNNHYKLLGAKMWLDGSPQGKTAWLTKPYYKVPEGYPEDYCGYGTQKDDVVINYMKECLENDYQLNSHCNGDACGDQLIKCYKKALELTGNKKDLRPVMVHAQTVREDQLDEMKKLGMIPTFFLDHIWYWGDYHYESVLGPERAERISPANSALRRGINFTLHQDPPVVMPIMTLALHNAVNRKTPKGRILGEDQKISIMDAIRAITINGAYQYFEENTKGSIEIGKLADLVILDKNPLTIPSEEIRNLIVLETIKEGKTVFKK